MLFSFLLINYFENLHGQTITNGYYNLKGIYQIYNLLNNKYLGIDNNDNALFLNKDPLFLYKNPYFRLYEIQPNSSYFLIESKNKKLFLGVDKKDNILLYKKKEIFFDIEKIIWKLIRIKNNFYFIKNNYNNKYLEASNIKLECFHEAIFITENEAHEKVNKKFIFKIVKLYEEVKKINNIKYVNKEKIDILIKYIDLSDKKLNREGIMQIYKDFDNEELRYSLRSILNNLSWVRKIFILMPNEKVRYLKSYEEIKEKIIYINDKDFLGFESANIFSFTFNLYKLENFGVSKNFIYLEDDFFIGKSLKKTDFFYYDEKEKKVLPFLLTMHFQELNKTESIEKYFELYKIRDNINSHSSIGWWFSIFGTEKYFMEKYKLQIIINPNFTHNAISENLDNLKEIYEEIKDYDYFNETIYSKERHILTLNQPHFVNLYQLNIKHKKVNCIKYRYISIEYIKQIKLKEPLFVLNTGGNHIPLNRQKKIQIKIMNRKFNLKTKYELINNKNINFNFIKKILARTINLFILISLIKLNLNFKM